MEGLRDRFVQNLYDFLNGDMFTHVEVDRQWLEEVEENKYSVEEIIAPSLLQLHHVGLTMGHIQRLVEYASVFNHGVISQVFWDICPEKFRDGFTQHLGRINNAVYDSDFDDLAEEPQRYRSEAHREQWKKDAPDDSCAICFDSLKEKSPLRTECNHWFHEECLDIWLKNHDTCPICRSEIL
jgi:hypothetical protein